MIHSELPDEFFEALGEPKPGKPFDLLDAYRFDLCYRQLCPGSVLDVGAYFGDFLILVRKDGREVFGSEVNISRVNLVNSILGDDIVVMDFRNGHLKQFQDSSVDNVVCMETVEHVLDDRLAVSELCRVARTKVVITVPFREHIQSVLCIHCSKYTPYSGHQHSYDLGTFLDLVPEGWRVTKQQSFAKRLTGILGHRLPKSGAGISILRLIDSISPGAGRWLLIVLEPI